MDYELLRRLVETPGVSGMEEQVRQVTAEALAEFDGPKKLELVTDPMGNLIAHLPGDGPRTALLAHMDEVGFLVSKFEDSGFIRLQPVGGIDPRVVWAQQLIIHGQEDLPGLVGSVPPHLSGQMGKESREPSVEDMFVDLGLPQYEVKKSVSIGDQVTFACRTWENDHVFCAKALDDRVGVFVMIEALRRATKVGCDLYLIGTTQEEVGLRGAGPAVFSVRPEIVVALEGTFAADAPGQKLPANLTPTIQDSGPEIRLTDRQMSSDRKLAAGLIRLAESRAIDHQVVVKKGGTTDAAQAQITAAGTRAITVSVPVRYIHGPAGIIDKADLEKTVDLMAAFLEEGAD